MDKTDINFWSNLTFRTQSYRKNLDFVGDDDNIITEHEGDVSVLRMSENKPPLIIGEYNFSVWNIENAKLLNIDLIKLMNVYSGVDTYNELIKLVNNKLINITIYKRIVLIHSFILSSNYRKRGISEEFIEFIYRDFHNNDTLILILVEPIQYNSIDDEFYTYDKNVYVNDRIDNVDKLYKMSAYDYYSMNDLKNKDDKEINEYKLFALAQRLGFLRVEESSLFVFTPSKAIERLKEKIRLFKLLNL